MYNILYNMYNISGQALLMEVLWYAYPYFCVVLNVCYHVHVHDFHHSRALVWITVSHMRRLFLQILTALRSAYCQPPPSGCPRDIYEVMVDCW